MSFTKYKFEKMCVDENVGYAIGYALDEYEKLKQENEKLKQENKDLYSGRLGACHTCEQVAELNIKLEQENEKLVKVISDIEFIVAPEREKFLISKWGKIYGKIQALRILHNIDIEKQ